MKIIIRCTNSHRVGDHAAYRGGVAGIEGKRVREFIDVCYGDGTCGGCGHPLEVVVNGKIRDMKNE
jgi:hypothetical protein